MLVRKLVGKQCYLSPYEVEYAPLFYKWVNDLEVARTMTFATKNISLKTEAEVIERLSKEHNYLIVDLATDAVIGCVGLLDIDHVNRCSEIGLMIGEKSFWGKGYAPDAMRALIGYAIDYLNLNSIMLRVYAFNERGLRCYEKVGFKKMGERRQALMQRGQAFDVVYMDLIAEEYRR